MNAFSFATKMVVDFTHVTHVNIFGLFSVLFLIIFLVINLLGNVSFRLKLFLPQSIKGVKSLSINYHFFIMDINKIIFPKGKEMLRTYEFLGYYWIKVLRGKENHDQKYACPMGEISKDESDDKFVDHTSRTSHLDGTWKPVSLKISSPQLQCWKNFKFRFFYKAQISKFYKSFPYVI